ncbi:MAG: ATP-binding protein [Limnochordia bacterium]
MLPREELFQAQLALRRLCLYRSVANDPVVQTAVQLAELVQEDLPLQVLETYHALTGMLAYAEVAPVGDVGDPWQDHLLNLIIYDDNPFTRKAELVLPKEMGTSLVEAVKSDLGCLQTLYHLGDLLIPATASFLQDHPKIRPEGPLPDWKTFRGMPADHRQDVKQIKTLLAMEGDWTELVEPLAAYYAQGGAGLFGRFWGFQWDGQELVGIPNPDPIRLADLIDYEEQRRVVLRNTEKFLRGLPANNVLLYGDRGTGKSSTVKALLHEYGSRGLRLVEVAKQMLGDFPKIAAVLSKRPQRFIVFVDDLSFDEDENEYKELKAILEGSLAARPENVLIYATSNRRHLVKETFSDRDGELHRQDTVQEKLSLADRFGITVTYLAPDKAVYLSIVEGLAHQHGLAIDTPTLHRRALEWEVWNNGRSGRTARQFIDHLIGELALKI